MTRPPPNSTPSPTLPYRVLLVGALLVVAGLLFRQLVSLLVAVVITVIVAIALSAIADPLERRGVPRPLGVLAGMALGLGALAIVLALIIPSFASQAEDFADRLPDTVSALQEGLREATDGSGRTDLGAQAQRAVRRYLDDPAAIIGPLATFGLGVAGVLAAFVLILITAYYMAVRPQPLLDGVVRLFPPERRGWARHVMARLREAWMGWLRGVAADMLVTGTLLYVGLRLADLEFAVVFAVLSALLVVVPYFGSVVGALPPVLFALTDSPGKALLVLAIYVLVQQVEGNLVIPLIMARTVKLHPAVIAIGVVLVGQVLGVLGLFVAVPLISMVSILVEEAWVRPLEEGPPIELPAGADRVPP